MLGSITPLGERGRGRNWARSTVGLIVGGAIGGVLLGGASALAGQLLSASGSLRLQLLAGAALIAVIADASGTLPTVHRQVNEDWLYALRDWVYGTGFGIQLGTGFATIVSTASVYLVAVAAFLVGSVLHGIAIGIAFGGLRTSTVLLGARVKTPQAAITIDRRLESSRNVAHRATLAVVFCIAIAAWAASA